MKVYLVAGKSGSGKSEVSKIIKNYYLAKGLRVLETQFSKYLKIYAKEILGWKENEVKPRAFLQDMGVKIRKEMNKPLMFINRMIDDLQVYEAYFDVVIINDVRLPDEIEKINEVYQEVYSLYVVNQFQASSLSIKEQIHETEIALEDYSGFDTTIINDDINSLNTKVITFIDGRHE
ncbi:MAG: hypothetical protein K2J20_04050 [Bacilli bacterium]|nr:hypothetical protein [Bacilli bacterium]